MDYDTLDATQAMFDADEGSETGEDEDTASTKTKPVGYLRIAKPKDLESTDYPVYEGSNIIGRRESCQICIPSKALSKEHACIIVKAGSHLIYDKGSRNKSKRGKLFLSPEVRYELQNNNDLVFADVECTYIIADEANGGGGSETEEEIGDPTSHAANGEERVATPQKSAEILCKQSDDEDNYTSDASSDILQPTQPYCGSPSRTIGLRAVEGKEKKREESEDISPVMETPEFLKKPLDVTSTLVLPESGSETDNEGAEMPAQTLVFDDDDDQTGNQSALQGAATQAFSNKGGIGDATQVYEASDDDWSGSDSDLARVDLGAATQAISPKGKGVRRVAIPEEKTQAYDMDVDEAETDDDDDPARPKSTALLQTQKIAEDSDENSMTPRKVALMSMATQKVEDLSDDDENRNIKVKTAAMMMKATQKIDCESDDEEESDDNEKTLKKKALSMMETQRMDEDDDEKISKKKALTIMETQRIDEDDEEEEDDDETISKRKALTMMATQKMDACSESEDDDQDSKASKDSKGDQECANFFEGSTMACEMSDDESEEESEAAKQFVMNEATQAIGDDATQAIDDVATIAIHDDATKAIDDDATQAFGDDATQAIDDDATKAIDDDATQALGGEDATQAIGDAVLSNDKKDKKRGVKKIEAISGAATMVLDEENATVKLDQDDATMQIDDNNDGTGQFDPTLRLDSNEDATMPMHDPTDGTESVTAGSDDATMPMRDNDNVPTTRTRRNKQQKATLDFTAISDTVPIGDTLPLVGDEGGCLEEKKDPPSSEEEVATLPITDEEEDKDIKGMVAPTDGDTVAVTEGESLPLLLPQISRGSDISDEEADTPEMVPESQHDEDSTFIIKLPEKSPLKSALAPQKDRGSKSPSPKRVAFAEPGSSDDEAPEVETAPKGKKSKTKLSSSKIPPVKQESKGFKVAESGESDKDMTSPVYDHINTSPQTVTMNKQVESEPRRSGRPRKAKKFADDIDNEGASKLKRPASATKRGRRGQQETAEVDTTHGEVTDAQQTGETSKDGSLTVKVEPSDVEMDEPVASTSHDVKINDTIQNNEAEMKAEETSEVNNDSHLGKNKKNPKNVSTKQGREVEGVSTASDEKKISGRKSPQDSNVTSTVKKTTKLSDQEAKDESVNQEDPAGKDDGQTQPKIKRARSNTTVKAEATSTESAKPETSAIDSGDPEATKETENRVGTRTSRMRGARNEDESEKLPSEAEPSESEISVKSLGGKRGRHSKKANEEEEKEEEASEGKDKVEVAVRSRSTSRRRGKAGKEEKSEATDKTEDPIVGSTSERKGKEAKTEAQKPESREETLIRGRRKRRNSAEGKLNSQQALGEQDQETEEEESAEHASDSQTGRSRGRKRTTEDASEEQAGVSKAAKNEKKTEVSAETPEQSVSKRDVSKAGKKEKKTEVSAETPEQSVSKRDISKAGKKETAESSEQCVSKRGRRGVQLKDQAAEEVKTRTPPPSTSRSASKAETEKNIEDPPPQNVSAKGRKSQSAKTPVKEHCMEVKKSADSQDSRSSSRGNKHQESPEPDSDSLRSTSGRKRSTKVKDQSAEKLQDSARVQEAESTKAPSRRGRHAKYEPSDEDTWTASKEGKKASTPVRSGHATRAAQQEKPGKAGTSQATPSTSRVARKSAAGQKDTSKDTNWDSDSQQSTRGRKRISSTATDASEEPALTHSHPTPSTPKRGQPGKKKQAGTASRDRQSQVDSQDSQALSVSVSGRKGRAASQASASSASRDGSGDTGRRGSKRKEVALTQESDLQSQDSRGATPTKRGRRGKQAQDKASLTPVQRRQGHASNTPSSQTPERSSKSEDELYLSPSLRRTTLSAKPKVLFTGVIDEHGQKILKDLGGEMAHSVQECTHLVTDKIRRTVKFLCGVARGVVIVTPQWLESCKSSGMFVDGSRFTVCDPPMEKQYKFTLKASIHKALQGPLLQGYQVHVTKSVKPEPQQMKEILQCAGAEYMSTMPKKPEERTVVISCEADKAACQTAIAKNINIVSAEFVLTGILRQEVSIDSFRLFSTAPGPSTSRSRR